MSPGSAGVPPACRGAALLAVLWLTVILSFVGMTLAGTVRTEVEATRNLLEEEQGYFLARGALEAAIYQLTSPPFPEIGQRELTFEFETGTARVEILPDTARLNVNIAPPEMLAKLLPQITQIPAELRPIRSLEEMLDWPGMTRDLYYGGFEKTRRPALEDLLTTRGGIVVDANYAHPILMASLPGMDMALAEQLDAARRRRPFRDAEEMRQRVPEPARIYLTVGGVGQVCTLIAHGRAKGAGLERSVRATARLFTQTPLRFRFIEWKE